MYLDRVFDSDLIAIAVPRSTVATMKGIGNPLLNIYILHSKFQAPTFQEYPLSTITFNMLTTSWFQHWRLVAMQATSQPVHPQPPPFSSLALAFLVLVLLLVLLAADGWVNIGCLSLLSLLSLFSLPVRCLDFNLLCPLLPHVCWWTLASSSFLGNTKFRRSWGQSHMQPSSFSFCGHRWTPASNSRATYMFPFFRRPTYIHLNADTLQDQWFTWQFGCKCGCQRIGSCQHQSDACEGGGHGCDEGGWPGWVRAGLRGIIPWVGWRMGKADSKECQGHPGLQSQVTCLQKAAAEKEEVWPTLVWAGSMEDAARVGLNWRYVLVLAHLWLSPNGWGQWWGILHAALSRIEKSDVRWCEVFLSLLLHL